jgi:hypothetical protein
MYTKIFALLAIAASASAFSPAPLSVRTSVRVFQGSNDDKGWWGDNEAKKAVNAKRDPNSRRSPLNFNPQRNSPDSSRYSPRENRYNYPMPGDTPFAQLDFDDVQDQLYKARSVLEQAERDISVKQKEHDYLIRQVRQEQELWEQDKKQMEWELERMQSLLETEQRSHEEQIRSERQKQERELESLEQEHQRQLRSLANRIDTLEAERLRLERDFKDARDLREMGGGLGGPQRRLTRRPFSNRELNRSTHDATSRFPQSDKERGMHRASEYSQNNPPSEWS